MLSTLFLTLSYVGSLNLLAHAGPKMRLSEMHAKIVAVLLASSIALWVARSAAACSWTRLGIAGQWQWRHDIALPILHTLLLLSALVLSHLLTGEWHMDSDDTVWALLIVRPHLLTSA